MKNIFHRHRYKIIGTGDRKAIDGTLDGIYVDILCKCGKCGTVLVSERFKKKVINQAANGKYFNAPIICVEEIISK